MKVHASNEPKKFNFQTINTQDNEAVYVDQPKAVPSKEYQPYNYDETEQRFNTPSFQTPWNLHHVIGEVNNLPSQTVPDQAMSIGEIMQRFTHGLTVQGREPLYEPENDLPDPKKLDLVDLQEMRQELTELQRRNKAKQDKANKALAEKKEADARKAIEDDIRAKLQAESKPV